MARVAGVVAALVRKEWYVGGRTDGDVLLWGVVFLALAARRTCGGQLPHPGFSQGACSGRGGGAGAQRVDSLGARRQRRRQGEACTGRGWSRRDAGGGGRAGRRYPAQLSLSASTPGYFLGVAHVARVVAV